MPSEEPREWGLQLFPSLHAARAQERGPHAPPQPGASSTWLSLRDSGVLTDLSPVCNQGTFYLSLCLKGPPFPPNKASQTVRLAKALWLWPCVCLEIGLTRHSPTGGGCRDLRGTSATLGACWGGLGLLVRPALVRAGEQVGSQEGLRDQIQAKPGAVLMRHSTGHRRTRRGDRGLVSGRGREGWRAA